MIEGNIFLQHHAVRSAGVIFLHQLTAVVYPRHAAPAATIEWFDECRQPDMIDYAIPIERILEIPKRLGNHAVLIFSLWKENGFGYRNPQISCKRVIEEFIVGIPPKWIVNYFCSCQDGAFEICSVEGYLV